MGGVGAGMMGGAGGLVTPPSTVMSEIGLNVVPTTGAGIGELVISRLDTRGKHRVLYQVVYLNH